MKRIIALFLCMIMVIALVSCTTGSTPQTSSTPPGSSESPENSGSAQGIPSSQDHKTFKIGVVELGAYEESVTRQKYYNEYLAPYYNCVFYFSEACGDTAAVMTFIENCADLGCDAIICYYNNDCEQLTQKCADYGMVFVQNANRNAVTESAFVGGYDNFAGTFAANQDAVAKLFEDYLVETLDVNGQHGFIVCSGWAYVGNEQHYKISAAILSALEKVYGLTYDEDTSAYLQSSSPINAVNDKDIPIYIYPDISETDGWLQGMGSALQTGTYDYLMGGVAMQGSVIVDEIERAYNKNIAVISMGQLGEGLTVAFSTKDMFNNSSIDMAAVKFATPVSAMSFIQVYNTLTGYKDSLKFSSGDVADLKFKMSAVTSLDQLEVMNGWDKGEGSWVADLDFIDSCLGIKNEGLTGEDIQANIDELVYDNIVKRLNK